MTESRLKEGIVNKNNAVIRYLTTNLYPEVEKLVLKRGGTKEDSQDIFNDAFMIVYLKLRKGNLDVKNSISSYIFGIAKYKWFQLSKERALYVHDPIDPTYEDFDEDFSYLEKRKLFKNSFMELKPDCQKVLNLFFDGKNMKEIALIMNFKNASIAKKKKFYCKEKLISIIKKTPIYQELINNH